MSYSAIIAATGNFKKITLKILRLAMVVKELNMMKQIRVKVKIYKNHTSLVGMNTFIKLTTSEHRAIILNLNISWFNVHFHCLFKFWKGSGFKRLGMNFNRKKTNVRLYLKCVWGFKIVSDWFLWGINLIFLIMSDSPAITFQVKLPPWQFHFVPPTSSSAVTNNKKVFWTS